MDQQPVPQTSRLTLRPFARADAPVVQRLAGAREIASTTLNIPQPYEDGAAEAWIDTHPARLADGTAVTFAIVLRESDELIGATSLMIDPAHRRAELGFCNPCASSPSPGVDQALRVGDLIPGLRILLVGPGAGQRSTRIFATDPCQRPGCVATDERIVIG